MIVFTQEQIHLEMKLLFALSVCVSQFVQSIGLDKRPFHLVGGSMGGNVAGVYAAHYSAHLTGVTLICPAGKTQQTSDLHHVSVLPSRKSNLRLFHKAE